MSTFHLKPAVLAMPFVAAALLGGCVSQDEYDALNAKYTALGQEHEQYKQQSEAQIASLNQQVAGQGQHVERLQSALSYTLSDDMLFRSGSWKLSAAGQDALAGMAQKLGPYQQSKIVVNGYTDNQPVGAGLKRMGIDSNDTLSQKRAEAVVEWLVQHGAKAEMVTAKGWGEASPIASNDTAAGRSKNRRVEITTDKS